jgi:hypothetical protein
MLQHDTRIPNATPDCPEVLALLCKTMREQRSDAPFETLALAPLPDELHAMWTSPTRDDDDHPRRVFPLQAGPRRPSPLSRAVTVVIVSFAGTNVHLSSVGSMRACLNQGTARFIEKIC